VFSTKVLLGQGPGVRTTEGLKNEDNGGRASVQCSHTGYRTVRCPFPTTALDRYEWKYGTSAASHQQAWTAGSTRKSATRRAQSLISLPYGVVYCSYINYNPYCRIGLMADSTWLVRASPPAATITRLNNLFSRPNFDLDYNCLRLNRSPAVASIDSGLKINLVTGKTQCDAMAT
jgi:hypothetical protein